jgi:hypothetical protein
VSSLTGNGDGLTLVHWALCIGDLCQPVWGFWFEQKHPDSRVDEENHSFRVPLLLYPDFARSNTMTLICFASQIFGWESCSRLSSAYSYICSFDTHITSSLVSIPVEMTITSMTIEAQPLRTLKPPGRAD